MFWFPNTCFIYNLHRGNIFLLYWIHTCITCYNTHGMHEFILWKRKVLLLGMAAPCTWQRISFLAGPLLKANHPIWGPPSIALLPIALFPGNTEFFLHSDYINKPDPSSVGHSFHIWARASTYFSALWYRLNNAVFTPSSENACLWCLKWWT
jgi:hypothetical protein